MALGATGLQPSFGDATEIRPTQKYLTAIWRKAQRDLRITITLGPGLKMWIARMNCFSARILFRPDFKNIFWRAYRLIHSGTTMNGISFATSQLRSAVSILCMRRLHRSTQFTA